jgi:type II secretory pathway component PulF
METTASLDDVMALNDQLAAMAAAGVPLDIGLDTASHDAAAALEKINAALARRVSRGQSLLEALEDDDPSVPRAYRRLVQLGLRTGDLYAGLAGSHRLAESVERTRYGLRAAFLYPLVVCCLALAGLVAFCLFFVPTLEEMYAGMRIRAGAGLRTLQSLREALLFWIAIPPLASLLLFLLWQSRGRFRRRTRGADEALERLPGMARAAFQQRCANFAEDLAALLIAGVPLREGLRLAAEACGDAGLSEGARALAAASEKAHTPAEEGLAARHFPPFLRWALLDSEPTTSRPSALRMAAGVYRQSAERRAERLRLVAPMVVCAVLGGGATLLYGLALFVPVVEMLQAIGS